MIENQEDFNEENFVEMLTKVTKDGQTSVNQINFDGKLAGDLCSNLSKDQNVSKNDAGLILLALKAKNLKALKILLENERL